MRMNEARQELVMKLDNATELVTTNHNIPTVCAQASHIRIVIYLFCFCSNTGFRVKHTNCIRSGNCISTTYTLILLLFRHRLSCKAPNQIPSGRLPGTIPTLVNSAQIPKLAEK